MFWLSALERLSGDFERNARLASRTTWGVGGRAEILATPGRVEDIRALFAVRAKERFPLHVLGGGSNLLIRDSFLPGVVLSTTGLRTIQMSEENGEPSIVADAGAPLFEVVALAARHNLSGIEFAVGIPGSIGGAVAGNAGTPEHAMADLVAWVEVIEAGGSFFRRRSDEVDWGYRFSSLASEEGERCIVRCALRLRSSERQNVLASMRRFWERRRHQPYRARTAGSVFKNPVGRSAGELLDRCGCKGMRRGGACVSEIHANFIENVENASSDDILFLIRECRKRVREVFGISLVPEIRVFGYEKDWLEKD